MGQRRQIVRSLQWARTKRRTKSGFSQGEKRRYGEISRANAASAGDRFNGLSVSITGENGTGGLSAVGVRGDSRPSGGRRTRAEKVPHLLPPCGEMPMVA